LLERFVRGHDEAAFTVLIERHGPMVLGVCRRALPNFHDAEDACQATFLVLARKAASVRKKTSLCSWLHGVACRVAVNLKRDHARRKTREGGVHAPAPKDPAAEVSWREVQAILDEELQRLPGRYRAPVILCYLECLTRDDAAGQLGLSAGSLHGRLERARDLLRERLTRRGLTLAAVMSAAALGESVGQAALEPTLIVSSTKAALQLAAGQPLTEGVVATHVFALSNEVLKTMFLSKLKLGAAAALCAVLFVTLIGVSFASLGSAQVAQPKPVLADALPTQKAKGDKDFNRPVNKNSLGATPAFAPAPPESSKPKGGPLAMKFVPLPKGTFYMGWDSENSKATKTEIKEDFEIAVCPVTQGQWQELMGNNPSYFSRAGKGKDEVKDIEDDDLKQFPVEQVSWDDAQEFIKKLNAQEKGKGRLYRLPTEAEWEYACRGGATSEEECSYNFYFAKPTNDLSSTEANFDGKEPAGKAAKGPYLERTTKVGLYPPNKLGIYDMHGNVLQWCADLYDPPASVPGASLRVYRGGSWISVSGFCRAAFRAGIRPDVRLHYLGFRLARVPVQADRPKPKTDPPGP
jgi:RNA polymerase sigma factor (sigma-70 family)